MYARDFVDRFPIYLNSPFATVARDDEHHFAGSPLVYKFHGISEIFGVDIAKYHHDWVAVLPGNSFLGFSVTTLERRFRLLEDAKMAAEGAIGGGLMAIPAFAGGAAVGAVTGPGALAVGGVAALGVGTFAASTGASGSYFSTFKHFLAGRRSWRIDTAAAFGIAGASDDELVLETAAVERYSCDFYRLNGSVQGLENKIPDIWNSLLRNFVTMRGVTVVADGRLPPSPWGRDRKYNTEYFQRNTFPNLDSVKSYPEFQSAYRLHPNLLP
jgi:hypothetical protein